MDKMFFNQYMAFESLVAEIFTKAGFHTEQESKDDHMAIDILAHADDITYAIEVKYVTNSLDRSLGSIRTSLDRIAYYSELNHMIPVLVISSVIKNETKLRYQKMYHNLVILDTANLLYVTANDPELYNSFVALMPSTIDEIEPLEPEINLNWLEHHDSYHEKIQKIDNCPTGKKSSLEFEELCCDTLKYILSDDLTLWKQQKKSNSDLYRFDLLCRIKDDNHKSFWTIAEQFFHSKYIIFEFKNYRGKITQKEIYTTEKYLYSKALRSIGVIISANGADNNATWAAKGVFRETGKLILLLDKNDLKEMCRLKKNNDDPANFLMEKLDELLSELEK